MKTAMICAGLLALACAWPARAADVREQTYSVGADVDAQGRVVATQFEDGVSASVTKLLAAAAQQWRFVPAKVDGQAVPAHTFISAKLRAMPNAQGSYNLRISYAGNGPRLDRQSVKPFYPTDAIRMRQSAFVLLDVTVQPDGSLTDAKVTSQFENWPVLPSFKQSVLAWAKQWRAVPEQVNGHAVATHMRVPVSFMLDPPTFTHQQLQMLRAYARKEKAANEAPGIPLPSEQEVALDSPLQPQSVASVADAP